MIYRKVTETKPGVYVLNTRATILTIQYVGRSDSDVNDRLNQHVGEKYDYFKFQYASSPKDAFEKECEIYHDDNPPDNKIHPDRPDGTDWQCPRCDHFKK